MSQRRNRPFRREISASGVDVPAAMGCSAAGIHGTVQ